MRRHSRDKVKSGWHADMGDCWLFANNAIVACIWWHQFYGWCARFDVGDPIRSGFGRRCDAKRWVEVEQSHRSRLDDEDVLWTVLLPAIAGEAR